MAKEPDVVVVYKAPSQVIAEMIADALQSRGIPAFVDGAALQDEFAVSQKILRLSSVNVRVHRDRVEEARAVLDEMREAGEALSEEGIPDDEPRNS